MPRIEEPEVRPTPLEIQHAAIATPQERLQWRMDLIADAIGNDHVVTVGQIELTWLRKPQAVIRGNRMCVRHVVEARRLGTLIFRDAIQQWDKPPFLRRDPNSYHIEQRFNKSTGTVGPVEVDNIIDDSLGATVSDILHTVRVVTQNGTVPHIKDNPGTVSTFYPSADNDIYSNSTVWTTTCAGSNLDVNTYGTGVLSYWMSHIGEYHVVESFLDFDTSAITDSDTISAVAFSLWCQGRSSAQTGNAVVYDYSSGAVTTADWQNTAALQALTEFATLDTSTVTATGAYYTFVETGTNFQAAINKTGTTSFCVGNSFTETPTTPASSTSNYIDWYASEQTGTANDPKLVVTHAAGGASVVPIIMALNRRRI